MYVGVTSQIRQVGEVSTFTSGCKRETKRASGRQEGIFSKKYMFLKVLTGQFCICKHSDLVDEILWPATTPS